MSEEMQKKNIYEDIYRDKKINGTQGDFIAGKHTYGLKDDKDPYKVHTPNSHNSIPKQETFAYNPTQQSNSISPPLNSRPAK